MSRCTTDWLLVHVCHTASHILMAMCLIATVNECAAAVTL